MPGIFESRRLGEAWNGADMGYGQSGIIQWDPFFGGGSNKQQMYGKFHGFPLVHCLGWKYNDPCLLGGKMYEDFIVHQHIGQYISHHFCLPKLSESILRHHKFDFPYHICLERIYDSR